MSLKESRERLYVSRAVSEIALRVLWSAPLLAPSGLAFPERQRANVENFSKVRVGYRDVDTRADNIMVGFKLVFTIHSIDIRFKFLFNDRDHALLQRVLDHGQHQAVAQSVQNIR